MFDVIPVPAFNDNYLWLITTPDQRAYVVDPGDGNAILEALEKHQLTLSGIIVTHHHPDHTGGIPLLLETFDVPVYGPAGGSVPAVTQPVGDGDTIEIAGATFEVYSVPGHTLDHLAYFYGGNGQHTPVLFSGDTLFAGGCGRLFEGTPAQMLTSLDKLAQLPDNTQVYCAHEYTMANLTFAQAVEPDNAPLAERLQTEKAKRDKNIPTVPTTIALERATNPFLRSDQSSVAEQASSHAGETLNDRESVFAAVRAWKDNF
ncbi:hydroxyacylglutathione hydrolase [Aurantivibrio plasticivorans]